MTLASGWEFTPKEVVQLHSFGRMLNVVERDCFGHHHVNKISHWFVFGLYLVSVVLSDTVMAS